MSTTKNALLWAALATSLFACEAKVEVTAGGGGNKVEFGTFTCAEVKNDACVDPKDRFPSTVPAVHVIHQTKDLPKKGDVYAMQWIAEDVGSAAPANTVVATLNQEVGDVAKTTISYFVSTELSKPTTGWPVGKYRVEVKLGDKLVTSAQFAIE